MDTRPYKHILVVEDDPLVSEVVVDALDGLYDTSRAETSAAAMECLQGRRDRCDAAGLHVAGRARSAPGADGRRLRRAGHPDVGPSRHDGSGAGLSRPCIQKPFSLTRCCDHRERIASVSTAGARNGRHRHRRADVAAPRRALVPGKGFARNSSLAGGRCRPLTNSTLRPGCSCRAREANAMPSRRGIAMSVTMTEMSGMLPQHLQALDAVRRLVDMIAQVLQHPGHCFAGQCIVIHHHADRVEFLVVMVSAIRCDLCAASSCRTNRRMTFQSTVRAIKCPRCQEVPAAK